MDSRHLDQLKADLRDKGYARSYINRLCGELLDHAMCAEEESNFNGNTNEQSKQHDGLQRLGSLANVSLSVQANPELGTWMHRHPTGSFILMPTVVVLILSVSAIYSLWILANLETQTFARKTLVNVALVARWLLPLSIVLGISLLALRRRISYLLPIISSAVFCLGAFVCVDVADCTASDSTFFRTYLGWSPLNFAAPWLACLCPFVAAMALRYPVCWATALGRDFESKSTCGSARRILQHAHLVTALTLVAGLITAFYITVQQTKRVISTHATDGLIKSINSPAKMQSARIEQLQNSRSQQQLKLTTDQHGQLQEILQRHGNRIALIKQEWTTENGTSKPMPMGRIDKIVAITDKQVNKILEPTQVSMLEKLAYQHLGVKILFRDEIQEELQLSYDKQLKLKDLELARIKANQAFRRTLPKGTWSFEVQQRLQTISGPFHSEMLAVLSDNQRNQLVEIRGADFRFEK